MVGWPTRRRRRHDEAQVAEVEFIDEDVDHPCRVFLADVILKAARQQRWLPAILTLDEAAHPDASDTVMSGVWAASRLPLRIFVPAGQSAA